MNVSLDDLMKFMPSDSIVDIRVNIFVNHAYEKVRVWAPVMNENESFFLFTCRMLYLRRCFVSQFISILFISISRNENHFKHDRDIQNVISFLYGTKNFHKYVTSHEIYSCIIIRITYLRKFPFLENTKKSFGLSISQK